MIGSVFNRLTVIESSAPRKGRKSWRCQCECGCFVSVTEKSLKSGNTKSCGCLRAIRNSERSRTHGESKAAQGGKETPEYKAWCHIKGRCHNPQNKAYVNYGGRGIYVCDRWRHSFETFLEDMGRRPTPKHTIDRIDNNKGYSPDNCRWATRTTQNRNTRANRKVIYNGQEMCLADLADSLGISQHALHHRLNRGWTMDGLWVEPIRGRGPLGITLEYNGRSMTAQEWADEIGLSYSAMQGRIDRGWDVKKIIEQPMRKRKTSCRT